MLQRRTFLGQWPDLNNSHFTRAKELISDSSSPPEATIQGIITGEYEFAIKLATLIELLEHATEQEVIERRGDLTNRLDRDCVRFADFPREFLTYAAEGVLIAKSSTAISREVLDVIPAVMRDFYNRCILQLLSLLPSGRLREKLFKALSLRDYLSFVAHGSKSGYGPFVQLLLNPHIPMPYKTEADSKMRVTIQKECGVYVGMRKNKCTPYKAKLTLPRERHEYAILWYVELLKRRMDSHLDPYPQSFFQDQLAFVHSLEKIVPQDREKQIRTLISSFRNVLEARSADTKKTPA